MPKDKVPKNVIDAFIQIRDYCNNNTDCYTCPYKKPGIAFYSRYGDYCLFNHMIPDGQISIWLENLENEGVIEDTKDEKILDKIKSEIETLPKTYPFRNHFNTYVKEDDVRKIIDKYKEVIENENCNM